MKIIFLWQIDVLTLATTSIMFTEFEYDVKIADPKEKFYRF